MEQKCWNRQWRFWENQNPFELVWTIPKDARTLDLPHDAMIEKPPHADSPNGYNTAFRDGGMFLYAKELYAPETLRDQLLMLKFEGVYHNAFVYVNGELAAKHPYGFSTFYVPLNPFLRYGQKNEIRVQARSGGGKSNRWYSGAGIYRDVYLIQGPLLHIAPDSLQIRTESVEEQIAVLQISAVLQNDSPITQPVTAVLGLFAPDGKPVGTERIPLTLDANTSQPVRCRMTVAEPQLWDTEHPSLYTCEITLETTSASGSDRECTAFGIRTMTLDAKRGLRINGKAVKLRGGCIHHDSGLLGAATYDDVKYRQILKLKQAGFNAVRMAHNPCSQSVLRACDRLGMYVMDEAFDMWSRSKNDYDYGLYFSEWWEKDVEEMVRKDFNHPSVILYSLGNEIPEIGEPHGAQICRRMAEKFRQLDPTRYTLAGINGIAASSQYLGQIQQDVVAELDRQGIVVGDVNDFMVLMNRYQDQIVTHEAVSKVLEVACAPTDIAGYNYMTARYEMDGKRYPNRIILGTETYPPEIARNWDCVLHMNHVIGDFTWAGWDYLGEAGVGIPGYAPGEGGFMAGFPAQLPYVGDFDLTGRRRPASYYREIVFGLRTDPYIVVENPRKDPEKLEKTPWIISDAYPCWTWSGCEGNTVTVEVYTPGDHLSLYLNGTLIGTKPVPPSKLVHFSLPYTPGVLEAIADQDGQVLGRCMLRTAGVRNRLAVTVEDECPMEQLIYLNLEWQDENGLTAADDHPIVTVSIDGPAVLRGFGTGNPKPAYPYASTTTELFMGCGQLILEKRPGTSVVTLQCEGTTSVIEL